MRQNRFTKHFCRQKDWPHINNMQLQNRIILSTVLLLIVPIIVILSFMFNSYISDKKNNELKLVQLVDKQTMENLDVYVEDIENLTLQPLFDASEIAHSLNQNDLDVLKILRESNYRAATTDSDISVRPDASGNVITEIDNRKAFFNRSINRIMSVKNNINSVFISNMDGSLYAYNIKGKSLYESGYNPTKEEWFEACRNNKSDTVILNSTKYTNIAGMMGQDDYVFPIARSIVDLNTSEIIGVICIYSDIDIFRDMCNKTKASEEERILVMDKVGNILYDTDERHISSSIKDKSFDLKFLTTLNTDKSGNAVVDGKDRLHVNYIVSGATGWKLMRVTPEKVIYGNIQTIQTRLVTIILAFVALSLFLTVMMVYRTTKPLKRLISTMKIIEKGDLSVRFKVKYNDEVGKLGSSFNKMIEKLEKLIKTVYVTELKNREAELRALQAQINPHFIYNTLESIRMMAELNDDVPTAKMVLILGKLLRYSIGMKDQKVTVRQDIEHLINYMALQNYRFSSKFDFRLEIEEPVYNVHIFKLLFQPIVENALFHGLETIAGRGYVLIKSYTTENGVYFDIEDNGVGMSEDQVESLNFKINDFGVDEKDAKSIGLKNINERIKLNYGENYGLRVFSKAGSGTTVRIELPQLGA